MRLPDRPRARRPGYDRHGRAFAPMTFYMGSTGGGVWKTTTLDMPG